MAVWILFAFIIIILNREYLQKDILNSLPYPSKKKNPTVDLRILSYSRFTTFLFSLLFLLKVKGISCMVHNFLFCTICALKVNNRNCHSKYHWSISVHYMVL